MTDLPDYSQYAEPSLPDYSQYSVPTEAPSLVEKPQNISNIAYTLVSDNIGADQSMWDLSLIHI